MPYPDQDMFFAQAYQTGNDLWSDIPFKRHAKELIHFIPKGAAVLDIGAGRGRLMRELGTLDFKVVGLENNQTLVTEGNETIKNNSEKNITFLTGTALNMPLADQSFDAAVDIGLMQHLKPEDFKTYISEVTRVLKTGGFFFLCVLSKQTQSYFKWNPATDPSSSYEVEGVHYHFFAEDELKTYFEPAFEIIQTSLDMPFGEDNTTYLVALLKKR